MQSRLIVVGVVEHNDKVLLGQKAENIGPYPNTWHIPGGGVDLDKESLEEAIKREVLEECDICVEVIEPIGFDEDYEPNRHGEMTHYVFLSFKMKYLSGESKGGDDIRNVQWILKDKLTALNLNKPSRKLFEELGWIKA